MPGEIVELKCPIDPSQVDADVRAAVEAAGYTQDDIARSSADRRGKLAILETMYDTLPD